MAVPLDFLDPQYWEKLKDDHPFRCLWNRWWGSEESLEVDRVIVVIDPQTCKSRMPSQLRSTFGKLLVRDEYEKMCARLREIYHNAPQCGVIVTGQPEIGKTVFLFYVLVRRLKDNQPTFFFANSTLFFLRGDGVFRFSGDLEQTDEYDLNRVEDHAWMLVDTDLKENAPSILVRTSHWPVQASPPDEQRFKVWRKARNARTLIMNPWSKEEIFLGLEVQSLGLNETTTAETYEQKKAGVKKNLEETIRDYGPIPGVVYEAAVDPTQAENRLTEAVARLRYHDLYNALTQGLSDARKIPYQVVLMRRKPAGDARVLSEDKPSFGLISERVADRLQRQLYDLKFPQSLNLITLFGATLETSVAGGWLFETISHKILTLNVPPHRWIALPPLIRMQPIQKGSRKYSVKIHVDPSPEEQPQYLPLFKCRPRFYEVLQKPTEFEVGQYLVPLMKNTLFDSLMFATCRPISQPTKEPKAGLEPERTVNPEPLESEPAQKRRRVDQETIYVLQMTTANEHEHGGSEKGLGQLRQLQEAHLGTAFVYVLVVPCPTEDRPYFWDLPDGWEDVKGPVYCQRMPDDMCRFGPIEREMI